MLVSVSKVKPVFYFKQCLPEILTCHKLFNKGSQPCLIPCMTDAACDLIPGHKQWLSIDLPQKLLVGGLGIGCHYLLGNTGAIRYLPLGQPSMREATLTKLQGSICASHTLNVCVVS